MISAVATRSQTKAPQAPTLVVDPMVIVKQGTQHKGPTDGIGQSRLPMTFGLADVAAAISHGTPSGSDTISEEDIIKGLALKVLQVPFFSGFQLQRPRFDPAIVYLMASKIMQGKVHLPTYAPTDAMQAKVGIYSSLVIEEDGPRVQAADAAEKAPRH